MSNTRRFIPVIRSLRALTSGGVDVDAPAVLGTAGRTARASARFVGFWLAVALPFCYLPLLAGGLPAAEATAFVGLLALNVVGLVVGRNYAGD